MEEFRNQVYGLGFEGLININIVIITINIVIININIVIRKYLASGFKVQGF